MEKILNQEEIDLLFRAAQGQAAQSHPPKQGRVVTTCDFRQAGQLTKEQVRQVTLLHDPYAPSVADSLGAFLRVAFHASLVAVEQITYGEFLGRLPEQNYVTNVSLMPLDELAAIQLDLAIIFPIIDLLLGGSGQGLADPRDLTEIEENILESVVSILCRELQSTWAPVLPLQFRLNQRLKQTQIVTLMLPGERVLCLSFEIRLSEIRGLFNLIFPSVVSNMLLRKLAQQGAVQQRRASPGDVARLREHLLDCNFTLALDLLRLPLNIRDVTSLQVDQILPLRHPLREPMSLSVNRHTVFIGVPVSCGQHRGGLIRDAVQLHDLLVREHL